MQFSQDLTVGWEPQAGAEVCLYQMKSAVPTDHDAPVGECKTTGKLALKPIAEQMSPIQLVLGVFIFADNTGKYVLYALVGTNVYPKVRDLSSQVIE